MSLPWAVPVFTLGELVLSFSDEDLRKAVNLLSYASIRSLVEWGGYIELVGVISILVLARYYYISIM